MTDDVNTAYWKAQAAQNRKAAADNLRLAAERSNEISELRTTVRELQEQRIRALLILAEPCPAGQLHDDHRCEMIEAARKALGG